MWKAIENFKLLDKSRLSLITTNYNVQSMQFYKNNFDSLTQ